MDVQNLNRLPLPVNPHTLQRIRVAAQLDPALIHKGVFRQNSDAAPAGNGLELAERILGGEARVDDVRVVWTSLLHESDVGILGSHMFNCEFRVRRISIQVECHHSQRRLGRIQQRRRGEKLRAKQDEE